MLASKLKNTSKEKRILAKNTLMLYILMASSYIFSFITIPYQTRILGPDIFGLLGFAAATMIFVQVLVDFGFMLHATNLVSRNRENIHYISKIYSSVMMLKLMLATVAIGVFLICCAIIPDLANNWLLFLLYLLSAASLGLTPDFLYRGMENMTPITIRSVLVRGLFAVMIFVLLHDSSQYLIVPLLLVLGNLMGLGIVLVDVRKRFNVRMSFVELSFVKKIFTDASMYFYSRIATQIYNAGSTIALGSVSSGVSLGYFVASNKLVTAARSGLGPIGDSIYPYMMKNKDFRLIKKVLVVGVPAIALVCIVSFIFAEQLCIFLFGQEFASAAPILRILLPIIVLTLPHYLLGFPTLGAIDLAKHANISIFIAAGVQILMLVLLFALNQISAVSVAWTILISEIITIAYRVLILYKYRDRLVSK